MLGLLNGPDGWIQMAKCSHLIGTAHVPKRRVEGSRCNAWRRLTYLFAVDFPLLGSSAVFGCEMESRTHRGPHATEALGTA
eukprot:15916519-Heterocapsa_arctica.AAC.1